MSWLGNIMDLPIGILPGSVPDDPAVPAASGDAQPAAARAAAPLSGRQLALQAVGLLHGIHQRLIELVQLQQTDRNNFLSVGTRAGGGTIGETPEVMLNGNPKRRGLSIQNLDPSGTITLGLGSTAPQPGTGIVLSAGESWDGKITSTLWVGSVSIVGSDSSVIYSWLEA